MPLQFSGQFIKSALVAFICRTPQVTRTPDAMDEIWLQKLYCGIITRSTRAMNFLQRAGQCWAQSISLLVSFVGSATLISSQIYLCVCKNKLIVLLNMSFIHRSRFNTSSLIRWNSGKRELSSRRQRQHTMVSLLGGSLFGNPLAGKIQSIVSNFVRAIITCIIWYDSRLLYVKWNGKDAWRYVCHSTFTVIRLTQQKWL